MNKEEMEIEIKSLQEVVYQLSRGCDARMCTKLNAFLTTIENKIKELKKKLNET